jgi:hypothetical protein
LPIPTTTVDLSLLSDEAKQSLIVDCEAQIAKEGDAVDAYYPKLIDRLRDSEALLKGPMVTIPNTLIPKIRVNLDGAVAERKKLNPLDPAVVKAEERLGKI